MQGHFGCLNSHRNILNKIKLEKNGMTIILEDDVEICSDFTEKLNSILDNLPDNWDLLYLGGWNVGELKKFTENFSMICYNLLNFFLGKTIKFAFYTFTIRI